MVKYPKIRSFDLELLLLTLKFYSIVAVVEMHASAKFYQA